MDIKRLLNAKTLQFVLVTVVLGAVGSGLWEWILKPFVMGLSEFGLNVATLGVHSFKNSLYKQVALGLHEVPSLRLYAAVFGSLPLFVLGIITGVIAAIRKRKAGVEITTLDKSMGLMAKLLLILFILLAVFSVIQANQLSYINRAVTYFNQLLAIGSPFISEQDRLTYRSQFAQISSGEDYEKLTSTLKALCKEKGQKTPAFSVW